MARAPSSPPSPSGYPTAGTGPAAATGDPEPDGAGTGLGQPARQRASVPSARPALIVVGIAAGVLLLFGIVAAVEGSSPPKPPPHPSHVTGTALTSEPAAALLRPVETFGTPPRDILGAVVVPKGTSRTGSRPWNGATQFTATVDFEVSASQADVVDFYRSELKVRGWSTPDVSAGHAPRGATQVLAERASTDGWYWQIGIDVSPTTFGGHSTSAQTTGDHTHFSLELFEIPDVQ